MFDFQAGKQITSTPQYHGLGARWSPDRKHVVDTHGRLWRVDDKGDELTPVHSLSGRRTILQSLASDPSHGKIAAAGDDGFVRLFSQDGSPLRGWKAPNSWVLGLAWGSRGERSVSAGRDSLTRVWWSDGKAGPVCRGAEHPMRSVSWHPTGKRLATGGAEPVVRMWEEDGKPGPLCQGFDGGVHCVAWSPDGKTRASTGSDGTVRLWGQDASPGPVCRGHTGWVLSVAWHPDGKSLASCGHEAKVRLWNADGTAGPVLDFSAVPGNRNNGAYSVAWSPDGKRLVAGLHDRAVCIWGRDGKLQQTISELEGSVAAVAWSPDSDRLLYVGEAGTIASHHVNGTPGWTAVALADGKAATFSPAGELLHGDLDVIENALAYVVEKEDGRVDVLKPSEFRDLTRRLGLSPK